MKRMKLFTRAGFGIVGLGALLCLSGTSFATRWQLLGDDGWDGAGPGFGLSVRTLGNLTLLVGFVVLSFAAWTWMNAKERETVDLRAP